MTPKEVFSRVSVIALDALQLAPDPRITQTQQTVISVRSCARNEEL